MDLLEFISEVPNFDILKPREKIPLFAWFLHTRKNAETIDNNSIRDCFKAINEVDPNVARDLPRLADQSPPVLIRVRGGYKLEGKLRRTFDEKYGFSHSFVQVSKLLEDLPGKVSDLAEKTFLVEALNCYRTKAYRACIVMVWNLAYNHLLNWLLVDPTRLARFNANIVKRNSGKAKLKIQSYDDFEDLKEREVVDICNIAGLINSSVYKILLAKLDRRNIAAHPSDVVIVQAQADDAITDLVNNVVLALI